MQTDTELRALVLRGVCFRQEQENGISAVRNCLYQRRRFRKKLREGKVVITSMGKGHFTNNGHFIVLRGITENGKILVNDPNSREKSNKEWSVSIIVSEAKGRMGVF